MPGILESLGFTDNPFASYVAENEPEIEQYFIRPPYYEDVTQRGRASRSMMLLGARGAGKSATRLAFAKEALNAGKEGRSAPLTVSLDDFSRIAAAGSTKADLGQFVSEVGYLVVEAVLVWLAAQEQEDRDGILEQLTDQDEALAVALVSRFYLTREALVRNSTVREPLKLLNQAWHKRGALWVGQKLDGIVALVSAVAQGLGKKYGDVDVKLDDGLKALLRAEPKTWNNAQYARAILERLTQFARAFGFSGITVLIDKVDETPQTNSSATATAELLYPLLSNTQLLEIDGFGWLFFLWDMVKEPYSSGPTGVRLDKIANAGIVWDDTFLRRLVDERLSHFSRQRIRSFADLCDESVNAEGALTSVLKVAMRSPRELIRVLDTVIREHDDRYPNQANLQKLTDESIDGALDRYTVDTLPRVFQKGHLQQLIRLGNTVFINRDVQTTFRIADPAARTRIKAWMDAGIVAQTGSRAAEGGGGGKPAHEYTVVDQRVRRLIERQLSLGASFDLVEDDGADVRGGNTA